MDRRQESGHRYTVFVDSTTAIDRVRTDILGPGQHFAITAMEVCGRVLARDNDVIIHWVPAHSKVAGNEKADEYAMAAARRTAPCSDEEVSDGFLTEARSRASAEWIASHVRSERRHCPLPPRKRPAPPAPAPHKERAGREVLPVPLQPWSIRVVP